MIFLGYLNYTPDFDSTFRYYVIISFGEILLGSYLVRRGAPLIVDYAYPDDNEDLLRKSKWKLMFCPKLLMTNSRILMGAGKFKNKILLQMQPNKKLDASR